MRPLRLDIAGFAAFRDPITVDFTDAEYFALTGPTGSGKSTVIDAMTFALYGSAPRWGRDNAIQYALAPTANRCAVRLVFDVAGQRYVVAREVRRSGKSIMQKNPRLERFLDPQATGDPEADEPVESLAADTRSVRQQVVELLGLDFDDFCTCVVLPQGDFATFLKASVADRQTILLKLLGARHYETIGRLANRRASDASARIDALQGQLAGYADATEVAETAARQREVALADLAVRVRDDVDALSEVLLARAGTARQMGRLTDELALLDQVTAPTDIADLQQSAATADETYELSSRAEREADADLADAERSVAAGPQRAPLEETLRWHADQVEASTRLPEVASAVQTADAALAVARQVADAREQELAEARADHDHHRALVSESARHLAELERRLGAVQSVTMPDGTEALDQAAAGARAAVDEATAALEDAEAASTEAESAVAALPERSAIAASQRSVDGYLAAAGQLETLVHQVVAATRATQVAERSATEAGERLAAARSAVERLTVTTAAAGLRPHLEVGHVCPVCDQTVAVLPPPLREPALDDARAALATAAEAERAAAEAASRQRSVHAGLSSQRDTQAERLAELDRQLLQDLPDRTGGADRDPAGDHQAVVTVLAELDQAQAGQQSALKARAAARTASRDAEREAARLAEQTRQGWELLHTTSGRLTALGAPAVTGIGLLASWTALLGWCRGEAETISAALASARLEHQAAENDLVDATGRLDAASGAAQLAVDQRQAAAITASAARTEHAELQRRLTDLATALADRPTEADARRLLAEHVRLDEDARRARTRAQSAGQARQQAEADRDHWRTARDAARAALLQIREPLVPLDVPTLDDTDLSAAWATLVAWASTTSAAHQSLLTGREAELAAADDQIASRLTALDERLEAHELTPTTLTTDELLASQGAARLQRLATEVEIAVERARTATAAIERRRGEAEALRTKIDSDTEVEQVARQLAQMMSARRFPQWLADAALDTLVADASASLLELSGRQFELTHEKGEFFVIDHADADSLRSVKTLSGGETFQASLALALALSEQLSTLAAGGRTTLDSIFLDEGFGTLDPDALEIVASTLENLAQGRRMVGVVTHVAALAERVPVRFEVSRDARTSTIERVGP